MQLQADVSLKYPWKHYDKIHKEISHMLPFSSSVVLRHIKLSMFLCNGDV